MSLIVLLVTIVVSLATSNLMDAFPGILWGWIPFLPSGLQWGWWILLLVFFAWCLNEQPAE
ncbi:MAG: hypothetical protein AAGL17_02660 [Cyanobacteria bacterium J06576_12]